ncbi:FAD-dependent thymidylate synthase [Rhizobium leguminosarum]|uniref:FAD-dependent thymidylate synthase n=1 Tax=Rhizobium leguminosarum TaxID=384 RepID=UPI0019814D8B|nr:FAD-dependent thymidylate synthase [Rhizobium leguminosarum]
MSGKERMFAKVILASKSWDSTALPLITMHLHYPDIIHGEVMTHRVFSRNARSMRAVPVATMVKEVREDPFVPWHWGKNQKGMQASEECNELVKIGSYWEGGPHNDREVDILKTREEAWRLAANSAADFAENYAHAGYHKQIANRIIAPYTWKHTLITSKSWANFFHLRDHEDAEPHFHDLAALVRGAIRNASYQWLKPGEWHLPYVTKSEMANNPLEVQRQLSVARSARISYAPFDGDFSIAREIERYDLLVGSQPLHASPTEHQATPDLFKKVNGKVVFDNPELGGNFGPGWIQFRKTLPFEYIEDTMGLAA